MVIKINDKAVKIIKYQIIILVIAYGLLQAKIAAINYIYNTFTAPFLAVAGNISTVHKSPAQLTTTAPLHIEYKVLKVPAASTIAAKK
jgi:hypothetical protein